MKNATWWKFWKPESGVFGGMIMGSLLCVWGVFLGKFMYWLLTL